MLIWCKIGHLILVCVEAKNIELYVNSDHDFRTTESGKAFSFKSFSFFVFNFFHAKRQLCKPTDAFELYIII